MTRSELLAFMRTRRLCVQASVSTSGAPQAAVVAYAVSDDFEVVFDTLRTTRKSANLRDNPRIAVVIGWDDEQTVQLEGVAGEPRADELLRLQRVYFRSHPDGVARLEWPGIVYIRIRPQWIRYSDFRAGGGITEFDANTLVGNTN